MQSGEKHVRPAVGLRRQIASGSLIHWSLEGPNWIMDSEVSACARVRVCVYVCVGLMRRGGPCWVAVLRGPLTLAHQFQSGSVTSTPPPPPFCHDPSPLGHHCPHVYYITVHYLVSAWRYHPWKPQGGSETKTKKVPSSQKKKRKGPIPFLLRVFLSRAFWG